MTSGIEMGYSQLLGDIKQRIHHAQYEALKAVNQELISLYWDIGRMIVERQQGATWGKSIVEQLAQDIQKEFPGIGGFSARNIWRMRTFYMTYKDNVKLPPLVAEIGWSHNVVILEKCKDDFQREFYIRMTRKLGWTKNVLIHQIENQFFEKTLRSQTNFKHTLPQDMQQQAILAFRDEYTFDFLGLGDSYSERQLETAILNKVSPFLQEMGGIFTFVGNQYRLEVGGCEFFIDLLLYHRRLKCLVAIELKIGDFIPEYVGKMQFCLAVLDDRVRLEEENPSIGVILCKSKNRIIVEYALSAAGKPIGVAAYGTTPGIPQKWRDQMPSPEQFALLLKVLEE
jgi:predicted nuclease of restriction endonuclease-like (RecB) superfamily